MEMEGWRGTERREKVLTEEERTVCKEGLCFIKRKLHAPFGICPTELTKRANCFIWHVVDFARSLLHVCLAFAEWRWPST